MESHLLCATTHCDLVLTVCTCFVRYANYRADACSGVDEPPRHLDESNLRPVPGFEVHHPLDDAHARLCSPTHVVQGVHVRRVFAGCFSAGSAVLVATDPATKASANAVLPGQPHKSRFAPGEGSRVSGVYVWGKQAAFGRFPSTALPMTVTRYGEHTTTIRRTRHRPAWLHFFAVRCGVVG